MTTKLQQARHAVNALEVDELRELQNEVARLIRSYDKAGVLAGRGWLEVKKIKKVLIIDGEIVEREHYYLYIRRAEVSADGKVTSATVGYYGKAGIEAVNAGYGDALLTAHNEGGESAGDALLESLKAQGLITSEAPKRRGIGSKPPASRPIHPLNDERITADSLKQSPVYIYFQQNAPQQAADLLADVSAFESDLSAYEFAQAEGHQFRMDGTTRANRRRTLRRKSTPQPARRIPRKRRDE